MQFTEGSFYHIYNRGNNKRPVFFAERNYEYFFQKIKKYIGRHCNLLAWCLMSNHFHLLVQASENSTFLIKQNPIRINALTEGIRMLLSSYTKGIQMQESITGNLFQQKTKFRCVDDYFATAFHYIHQNPYRAQMVNRIEDWRWSSFREYVGLSLEGSCKREIALSFLDMKPERLLRDSYRVIPDEFVREIL